MNCEQPLAITESNPWQFVWKMGPTKPFWVFPDSGLISGIFSTNFGLKMNYFLMNTPRMIHSDICFHMRWVGASEYHFDAYKCIRMGLNVKNAFSGFFGFPPKNFSSPYLSSPTWHRSHSVLKIIVWISSLLTNIIQHLRKHIKGTRASDVSLIENFENFQILPFWTQKPIFLYVKGSKWVWYINVI